MVSLSTNLAIFKAGGSKDGTPRAPEQNKVTIFLKKINKR